MQKKTITKRTKKENKNTSWWGSRQSK